MIAIFEALLALTAGYADNWVAMAMSVCALAVFTLILFDSASVFIRKMAFSVYVTLTLLFALNFILLIVLMSLRGSTTY